MISEECGSPDHEFEAKTIRELIKRTLRVFRELGQELTFEEARELVRVQLKPVYWAWMQHRAALSLAEGEDWLDEEEEDDEQ